MTDLFISYSRKNLTFVHTLADQLSERGYEAWVDLDNLYAGEEFWPEVTRAIDAATVFLFVLSPHSAESRVCGDEIAHAAKHGKRIVTVLRTDTAGDVPAPVAKVQWALFRENDDAGQALESLVAAIDADWEALRFQARLLRKAREWLDANQEASLLLRGRELKLAKRWQIDSAGSDVGPTGLHDRFLEASSTARRRAITRTVISAAAALVIMLTLGWLGASNWVSNVTNRSAFDVAGDRDDVAFADLERAHRLCRAVGQRISHCKDLNLSLGHVYELSGEYEKAIEAFSDSIAATTGEDDEHFDHRGNAYQSRAFSLIMTAEQQKTLADRHARYLEAEADVASAIAEYRKTEAGLSGKPFAKSRARIALGLEDYELAQTEIDTARRLVPNDPEIDLIQAAIHLCAGNRADGLTLFGRYVAGMRSSLNTPQWRRGSTYFEGVKQRCLSNGP